MSKPILQIWEAESQKYVPIPAIKGKDGKDGAPGKNGTNGTNGTNGKDGTTWFAQSAEPENGVNDGDLWLDANGIVHKATVGSGCPANWKVTDINLRGLQGPQGAPGADAVAGTAAATLTVQGWTNRTQTVSVPGVTSSSTVIVSPAPASVPAYAAAQVYCSAQGAGTLTFACGTVPAADLTVNVVILR